MIVVLFGEDTFRVHEALADLRRGIESEALVPDSTTQLDASARPDDLLRACQTLPLLGGRRLVIVRGLLARFEGARGTRRRKVKSAEGHEQADSLGDWQGVVDALPDFPESTALAFVDGKLTATNPLLQALRKHADVREFDALKKAELASWLRERAELYGANLEPRAVAAIADLVGGDLWTVDSELRKLATYAGSDPISEQDVRSMVTLVREANVFALADAMVEGRTDDAMELFQRRTADGDAPLATLALIARQYRLLLMTRELLDQRLPPSEIGSRIGVPAFVSQRLLRQAPAHSVSQLRVAYKRLLEADLSIKRGVYDDETALELLIFELSATRSGRPGYNTLPSDHRRRSAGAARGSNGT